MRTSLVAYFYGRFIYLAVSTADLHHRQLTCVVPCVFVGAIIGDVMVAFAASNKLLLSEGMKYDWLYS